MEARFDIQRDAKTHASRLVSKIENEVALLCFIASPQRWQGVRVTVPCSKSYPCPGPGTFGERELRHHSPYLTSFFEATTLKRLTFFSQLNLDSSEQKLLGRAARFYPARLAFSTLASTLGFLPSGLQKALLQRTIGKVWDQPAIDITRRYMLTVRKPLDFLATLLSHHVSATFLVLGAGQSSACTSACFATRPVYTGSAIVPGRFTNASLSLVTASSAPKQGTNIRVGLFRRPSAYSMLMTLNQSRSHCHSQSSSEEARTAIG